MKIISINKNKEVKLLKRKPNHDGVVIGGVTADYNQGFRKMIDEDVSNRSSSGSAISNSESCAQFGNGEASDLTGWMLTMFNIYQEIVHVVCCCFKLNGRVDSELVLNEKEITNLKKLW